MEVKSFKYIAVIVLAVTLLSCKSKKVYVETHTTDTIYKKEVIKIDKPQLNSIVVESPCDSLGNLKPINYVLSSNKVRTVLKTIDNKIYIEQNVDSIVNSKISEYVAKQKTHKEVIIKYKIPKWCYYSLLITLLLLVWTFRKFVPILRYF